MAHPENCRRCYICVQACPTGALRPVEKPVKHPTLLPLYNTLRLPSGRGTVSASSSVRSTLKGSSATTGQDAILFKPHTQWATMTEIFFLGTGGIMPTRERNVPAIAIRYQGEVILFDAGEGTIRQMNTTKLSPMKVEKIFITHFHGDHYLGLGGLIQTMNLWNRQKPLHIYGPKYTFEFLQNFLESGFFRPGFDIHVHELGETRLKFGDYEIWSFKVKHGIPALGYVFKEKDKRGKFLPEKLREYGLSEGPILGKLEREGKIEWNGRIIRLENVTGPRRVGVKIVYTGDTEPCERAKLFSEQADLLIHDATYLTSEDRGESYHSTVEDACVVAKVSRVKLLALFHRAFRYTYEEYLKHAERICSTMEVNFIVPRDFDILTFKSSRWKVENVLEERS